MKKPYFEKQKTFEQLLDSYIDNYLKSRFNNLLWNNRFFEPFHLLATDHNKSNNPRITDKIINSILHKPECYICTGDHEPRPMGCYKSKECKLNARFDTDRKFMETKNDKKDPNLIYMGRHILVTNYFYQFPIIVRTAKWTNTICHHFNGDGFDDSLGNHSIPDMNVHTGAHNEIRSLDLKILQANGNQQKIDELNRKKQIAKNWLVNSQPMSQMIYYMYHNYNDVQRLIMERMNERMAS